MRIVRALLGALLAVGIPRMARADPAPPAPPRPPRMGIEMTFTRKPGAENCESRDTMELLLIGEYHYDPFDLRREEVHIVVEISLWRKNGEYRGRYTIALPGEEPLAGEETADRKCTEVLRDIASAIMIDTYLRFPAPKPEPPPVPSAPEPAPLPPAAPAAPPPATLPRRPTGDRPKPPLSPWVMSAEPSIAFGLVPGVGLGGAVALTHRWQRYSVGLSASWFTTLGKAREAYHLIRGSFIEGTIIPCRMLTGSTLSVSLSLCAPVGFGFRTLSLVPGVRGVEPRVASPGYYSLGIGGRVQIENALTNRIIIGGFAGLSTAAWSRAASSLSPDGYTEGRKPPDGYGTLVPFSAVGTLGLYVGVRM